MSAALEAVWGAAREGLEAPTRLTVSEWADQNRILTRETTAAFGPWRTSRVPFAREIMDSLSALDPIQFVSLMKAAQIAGTETGLNWIGYSIAHDPSPFLLVVPNFDFAKKYSKRRIRPMIDACPQLKSLVAAPRSRDSGNTLIQKDFPGGTLVIASAQSAAALSSDPIRRIMADEVDRFPHDVDQEGTPIALASVRTTTFANRKIYLASTPGKKETSHIEPAFLQGDMRRYYVPCLHCGRMDFLTWAGSDPFGRVEGEHFSIRWAEDRPETAELLCPECGCVTEEHHKTTMLLRGEWRPTAPGDGFMRSYHLPGMYSPLGWLSWAQMAREFVAATREVRRGTYELLQDFVNLRLGETWEEIGEKLEDREIIARAEVYPAEVPAGVGVLVASVDVQGDRLEAQVTGWGAGEESWAIDWRQFHGDPEGEQVWFDLDAYLRRTWTHASGRAMPIVCTAIDSGGHHSEQVYAFCKPRTDRRVFAIKGGPEIAKPLVGKPSYNNKYRTPLFVLCVDSGKDRIYSRLKIHAPGPGYYHFPKLPWFDMEYVDQLTAEKKIRKIVRGRGSVPFWKKLRDRNEALDLSVYALAALYICGREFIEGLGAEAERWAAPLAEEESSEAQRESPAAPAQRPGGFRGAAAGSGWLNSWR